MNKAFSFGRFIAEKVAAGPGTLPSGTMSLANPKPFAGSLTVSGGSQGLPGQIRQPKPSGPSFLQSYGRTLDRWYNPWTTQHNYEKGEKGLMRAGQAAMGVGAVAGTAAAGLAAAPVIAGATGGGTATTAAAGGAAATQTPAGQNMIQRFQPVVQNVANMYTTRVAPTLEHIGYEPQDAAKDLYAAATGHFDHIQGPGWGAKLQMPPGAPEMPKPLEAWRYARELLGTDN